ncbi:hypothetical protein TorRG33x02_113540 [Trema orientale]|uniref:Uncharacterized protein n=1 Tax=Trema orientale TaxID=63057 RepID=A0A2P5F4P6_TREOI|nr:hypothetical protein TorRG33x02_113540 [Trema orientale]
MPFIFHTYKNFHFLPSVKQCDLISYGVAKDTIISYLSDKNKFYTSEDDANSRRTSSTIRMPKTFYPGLNQSMMSSFPQDDHTYNMTLL